jgi:ribokinase
VSSLLTGVEQLLARGPRAVAITVGELGATIGDVRGATHIPAVPANAIDTSGAGGAFVGVLAARLSLGFDLRDAVQSAVAAGAAAVRQKRAQLSTLEPVQAVV